MTFAQEDQTKMTYKITTAYEVTADGINKSYVVPIQYREVAYDVFICRVDYLIVRYEEDGLIEVGEEQNFPMRRTRTLPTRTKMFLNSAIHYAASRHMSRSIQAP
jgi:hypothetical protein